MLEIDEIYTDLVMEHSMSSPYKKDVDCPTCTLLGHNPNCGDEIKLEIKLDGDRIVDVGFSGHGCAISQGSTSIMIETLVGKTISQAKEIIAVFVKMIKGEEITDDEKKLLGNSIAFENIKNMPARVKCALLSWNTMGDILKDK